MINRRKLLQISAAAAGMGLIGVGTSVLADDKNIVRWRGVALGGEASMTVAHADPARAKGVLAMAVEELRRLEEIFSLYSTTSALYQLNSHATLRRPPAELVMLLATARQISEASSGVFDVTVQPLWDHYSHDRETDSTGLAAALSLVGQQNLNIARDTVSMKAGQKITLNGIAQGAITDHLTALFKREGFGDILLGTGEIRAMGSKGDAKPWRVALGGLGGPVVELYDSAIATSEPITEMVAGGKVHLFDPHSGLGKSLYRRVSVQASTATIADGLSTALSLMPLDQWPKLLKQYSAFVRAVYVEKLDGSHSKLI